MSDPVQDPKPDRPALPRDVFRAQRGTIDNGAARDPLPVVVTPDYGDRAPATASSASGREGHLDQRVDDPLPPRPVRTSRRKDSDVGRNPFDAYGERSSSRPYALRLPDPIDLVLRQIAAEERTFPLRVIDRILYDHLKKIGRLPPPRGT
jgi:hypothetical protein